MTCAKEACLVHACYLISATSEEINILGVIYSTTNAQK